MKIKEMKRDQKVKNNKNLFGIFKNNIILAVIVAGLGLGASQPAQAFMGYDYYMDPTNVSSDWLQQDVMRRTFENHNEAFKSNNSKSKGSTSSKKTETTGSKTSTTSTKKSKITFSSNGSTKGLEALVSKYPSKDRANVRKILKQLQDSFPQVARSVGIPTNDLSSGLSALLAGAYMAYNNVSLNDSYMKPLANQLKTALQSVEDFDRMSDSQKKEVYDQMVIIGMLLAVSQAENQKNPNSRVTSQLRTAGKQVLEGLLKVNASNVRITSSGLSY